MNRLIKTVTPVVLAAFVLGACNTTDRGSKETIGGITGAVLGGVLGSQVGKGKGQLVAVGAGAILGGLALVLWFLAARARTLSALEDARSADRQCQMHTAEAAQLRASGAADVDEAAARAEKRAAATAKVRQTAIARARVLFQQPHMRLIARLMDGPQTLDALDEDHPRPRH